MPSTCRAFLLFSALLLAGLPGCSRRKTAWPGPPANAAIDEARKLLTDAGYEFGNGFPAVELLYNTSESHKQIAAAVQDMWRKNLGLEIPLRNLEWKVYIENLNKLDYHVARRGWIADYPDPDTFIDLFTSSSGQNNTGWADPEFDRLVAEASRTADPRARFDLLQKAEAALMDALPIMPLYFYVSQSLWKKEVRGIFDTSLNVHPLKGVVKGDGSAPFVLNSGAEPKTLDPNLAEGQVEHRICLALFEGLTAYHPETLEPQPGVAESWTRSEDLKTWTFKLRDCTWSNGRVVTAHDFVYGWRRHIDPATGSEYAYIIHKYLKNGAAWVDGASVDSYLKAGTGLDARKRLDAARKLPQQAQARHVEGLRKAIEAERDAVVRKLLEEALAQAPKRPDVTVEQVGVRAADDRTLVVELQSPTPHFLHLTTFFSYVPIPREAVEKHGERWIRPENIVTNGPFRMKEWKTNEHVLLERNPGYWDAAKVRQQQVKFLALEDIKTAYTMYRAGQCDYVDTVPLTEVEALKSDPEYHSKPITTTYFFSFNVTRKPFDDPRVRRALALAVDRESICRFILKGGQTPAYNVVPPVFPGYTGQAFTRKAGP